MFSAVDFKKHKRAGKANEIYARGKIEDVIACPALKETVNLQDSFGVDNSDRLTAHGSALGSGNARVQHML